MLRASPAQVAALAEKYRLLLELRQASERGEPPPERAVFQALSARFPGALRELDRMPMALLERRSRELTTATTSGDALDWMSAQASYHELLRFALCYKQKPDRAPPPPTGADREFLDQLRAPPGGRVVPLVHSAIARVLACEVDHVIALLSGDDPQTNTKTGKV